MKWCNWEIRQVIWGTYLEIGVLVGGGNLEFLRVFLGHSDYNVTRGYSQLAAECKMLGVNVYHLDPIFFKNGY